MKRRKKYKHLFREAKAASGEREPRLRAQDARGLPTHPHPTRKKDGAEFLSILLYKEELFYSRSAK